MHARAEVHQPTGPHLRHRVAPTEKSFRFSGAPRGFTTPRSGLAPPAALGNSLHKFPRTPLDWRLARKSGRRRFPHQGSSHGRGMAPIRAEWVEHGEWIAIRVRRATSESSWLYRDWSDYRSPAVPACCMHPRANTIHFIPAHMHFPSISALLRHFRDICSTSSMHACTP